jgi:hypothetical protein
MKFHITRIKPPSFLHSDGFNEIIDSLSWALSSLGNQVVICENTFSPDGMNILFGAELLSKEQTLPDNVIIYNLEQGAAHASWENIMRLAKGKTVWDYNKQNYNEWKRLGYDCQHVPFGYTPNLTKIPRTEEVWDVFFSGWITPRRKAILEELRKSGLKVAVFDSCYGGARDQAIASSKICLNIQHDGRNLTNIQRLSFWMANSKCILSEFSADKSDYPWLEHSIVYCSYENIVRFVHNLLDNDGWRRNMGETALKAIKEQDYIATVAAALEHLPARNPILERYEKGCREGDMKEYLPWLRKNSRGRMLEIGVRDGASTSAMLLGLEENGGHLHSIDQNDCSKLWTHPRWTFEHNDSKKAIFPDNEFDAALIDGDHTKTGFLADLNNCYRWVKHGGIIMCHDIEAKQTSETCGGDFPSREVGEEYRKFVMGLTHFELPGEFGFGVIVVEK